MTATITRDRGETPAAARNGDGSRRLRSGRLRSGRLRSGELRGLVEDFLRDPGRAGAECTPGDIARKLGRSAGAVSNALDALALAGVVELVGERPRRFRLARKETPAR